MWRHNARGVLRALASVLAIIGVICGSLTALDGGVAAAEPIADVSAPNGSRLIDIETLGARQFKFTVHSAAMGKNIVMKVLRPADSSTPSPTLYLLSGVEGASDEHGWLETTDAVSFFQDKDVNVVVPYGGESSYYTDWSADDPRLGLNKWTTFLTKELPPIIDSSLRANGRNAIIGVSMSATSSLNLAIAAPGLYRGVGSFSGCARTSDPVGQAYVATTIADFFGNPLNMWGVPNDPKWIENDPYVNAEKLRGLALYITSNSGLPGEHDVLDSPSVDSNPVTLAYHVGQGGPIEALVDNCTRQFVSRLASLGIPANVNQRAFGTHSWGYWQDDLHQSWPIFEAALR